MSGKRSVWKNTPEGKTVRRNIVAQWHHSRPKELLESPALRILSRAAHLALLRIEIELRNHAGQANGKLIVTHEQFIEYGVRRHQVASALRELEALGPIIITVHGRGGNAEHREPNRFLLNYLCGAVDAHEQITNSWNRIQTMKEAGAIARAARANKNPAKVSYGFRISGRKSKTFPTPRNRGRNPPHEIGGETEKSPPHEMGGTAHPTNRGVLSILSGGGGVEGGESADSAVPLRASS
jgi:hypothetical protein